VMAGTENVRRQVGNQCALPTSDAFDPVDVGVHGPLVGWA